ncbi:MAG TPA: DUF2059 domain-containing protein [Verrucomicrobiae bacterium]|nr:DUF2059 domain-containing protein [Verrucomicrobiae bacterium]
MSRRALCIAFAAALLLPCFAGAQQSSPNTPAPAPPSAGDNSSPQQGSAPSASSQAVKPLDPQLKSDIHHLLATMDIQQASEAALRRTFETLKPQLTASLPPTPNREKIIDAYEDKLAGLVHAPEYEDGLVAIYARHFSDDEIKAIDQFYQTPAGKRLVQTLPEVMGEAEAFGEQTAANSIPRILQELCKEFPELQGEAKFCPADTTHRQSLLFPPRHTPALVVSSRGN